MANTNMPFDNGGDLQFCRKCGNRLQPDAVFCEKCGEQVRAIAQPQPIPPPAAQPVQPQQQWPPPAPTRYPYAAQSAPAMPGRGMKPGAVVALSAACTFAVLGGLTLLVLEMTMGWPF